MQSKPHFKRNVVLSYTILPKQFWTGKIVGNILMCQINLSCSFSHEKSPQLLNYMDFETHVHLFDCFLLRLISWKAQSTGTNSEQESLIWKQLLIKKTAKCVEASNHHRKTINCMASSLRPEFSQGLLEFVGIRNYI